MSYHPVNLQPEFDPCWGEEYDPPKLPGSWRERLTLAFWLAVFLPPLAMPALLVLGVAAYDIFS